MEENKIDDVLKNQCYECSSNDTMIFENELYCNNCGGSFVR